MPRRAILAMVLVLTIAAGSIAGLQRGAQAQDSTPAAEQEAAEGATFRALAAGSVEVLAPSTASLVLGRLILTPGTSIPFDPEDPSAILVYAAAGELTFLVNVPMTVARAGDSATPVPPEEIAADTEFTLSNGDSAIFPGSMTGEVRNSGAEEATAWVVDIVHITTGASTPTP